MTTTSDLWPPFGLVVRTGDLTLTAVTDADLPGLVDLVRGGIHPPEQMPFSTPWTDGPVAGMAQRFAQYHWSTRARFAPDDFDLQLAVRRAGELVGTQGFTGRAFPVVRSVETGSWLGARFQGQGIGTRMRRAVCALLFDHLGAVEVTSAAFLDNPASLAVSRAVGYRPDGVVRLERRGAFALNQRLVLTPETFVRGEPVEVSGAGPLRTYLGFD